MAKKIIVKDEFRLLIHHLYNTIPKKPILWTRTGELSSVFRAVLKDGTQVRYDQGYEEPSEITLTTKNESSEISCKVDCYWLKNWSSEIKPSK